MKTEQLDLRDLRCFVAVYDEEGFTAGARALGVMQSNVSMRVARLERLLGIKLFMRMHSRRKIERTRAAKRVYRRAQLVLKQAKRFAKIGRARK